MLLMVRAPAVWLNFIATSWYSMDVGRRFKMCTVTSFPAWLRGIGSQFVGREIAIRSRHVQERNHLTENNCAVLCCGAGCAVVLMNLREITHIKATKQYFPALLNVVALPFESAAKTLMSTSLMRCLLAYYTMDRVKRAFWLVQGSLLLKYKCTDDVISRKGLRAQIITTKIFKNISNFVRVNCKKQCIKQIDIIWPCLCTLITHRGCQNAVKTSVTLLVCALSEYTHRACFRCN